MLRHRHPHRLAPLARLFAAAALGSLAACGGDSDPPAPPPPVTIDGVVADGPLAGATACYDLNDNQACESGEPSSTTDTDGRYSFDVDADAAGAHAVIVDVPATAVDRDTGLPVGAALRLVAPPTGSSGAQSVFVSPLTTLVAGIASDQGLSVAQATQRVQDQLGLAASPLADFVAAGDTQAATLARTLTALHVEVAQLAAAAQLSETATQALIDSATRANLSTLAALVALNPGASTEALAQALLVEQNLTPATIGEHAEIEAAFGATPLPAGAPGPFFSMRRFTWTDAGNHRLQGFVGDSTPDADGGFDVSEIRVHQADGVAQPFNRNTAYWVESAQAWVVCPQAWQMLRVTPASATTPQKAVYCGASTSLTRVAEYDVAGLKMADVVAKVRASSRADAPGFDTDANGLPTKWGPEPAALGDTVFPAGARFSYRRQSNEVGNTERYSLTDKPRVLPDFRHAATFTDLKRMSGNWLDPNLTITNVNTVFLEDVADPAPLPGMSPVQRYRAGFDPGSDKVRFFACDVLASNNTSLNCEALGDGTATITIRADSRVLRFATGYPSKLTIAHKRQRLYVERDGVVFGGHRDLEHTRFQHRPNTTAWNALRTALGMVEPAAPVAPVADPLAFSLARFSFTDLNNFSYRTFRGEAPAADGTQVLLEQQEFFSGGVRQPWLRNALYWTGSEWYDCPDDPNGNPIAVGSFNDTARTSDYCRSYKDSDRSRSVVTLAGRSVQDVLRDIRRYPTKDGSYDYAGFGPDPETTPALVDAVFPAGAAMNYQGSKRDATPFVLFTAANNLLRIAPTPNTTVPFAQWPLATSLDAVIAGYPGDHLGGTLNGNTSQFVINWFLPAPPAPEFTNEVTVRVAFDAAGQKARFYVHNRLASNNNSSNYIKLLDTTYTIETAGDAKVLRFAALPPEVTERLAGERLYVERAGEVRFGAKDAIPARRYSLRLNPAAADFIGNLLGLP